ncbi:zinc finger protein 462-like isoform X2 [Chiloscyllium plagiosum]|nr:zinc finger protein 462-like isoform X2 [Chiloscyllium plagiosum]
MNPFCETVGKSRAPEDSNKQVAFSNTSATFAIEQVMDVCSIAHDDICDKPKIFNNQSELDHCLLKDTTSSFKSAEELEVKNLGHTKLETMLGVKKAIEPSESFMFFPLDGAPNILPKQIHPDKENKGGTEMEVSGKLVTETGKTSCLWCEHYTFNERYFEEHTKEQHSCIEHDKAALMSTTEPEDLGCEEQDFTSQVDSINNASQNGETIVRKSELYRTECKNPVSSSNSDDITDGFKPFKDMRQKSVIHATFRQKVRRTLNLKNNQTIFYMKRLCLFHCIFCRFHTLYRRCVLRHVRSMHRNQIGSPKCYVRVSNGLNTLKCCEKDCTLKKLTSYSGPLSLERKGFRIPKPDTSIRGENVNLMPSVAKPSLCTSKSDIIESKNCLIKQHSNSCYETSLVHDQTQFSLLYLANDSDVKTSSEIPPDPLGALPCFSSLMTTDEKITYGDLNIKAQPSSRKCLALEAIVESLKSRVASPIKCRPAVTLLNDRIARPRRSIPFCRTTEEQQAKWVMEAYNFLKQQKIERAAEFSSCDDDYLLDAMAEIEVVLSDTDDKSNNSKVYRNYGTLNENIAKATEDKSEILSLPSSANMEPGNVCTLLYKCDICPFSSANIISVLSHYGRQHPEEDIPYHRIQKYSCKMNMQMGLDLHLPTHSLSWVDSKSADSLVPCFTRSSALCFCEHCSFSGDWISLIEHYQKFHTSTNLTKYGGQKKSARRIVNNVQARAPLASTSTSSSEPQVVFQCQLCNFTCSSRRVICRHYCIRQSIICAQVEDSDILFKCALCGYTHLTQEGLINHYLIYHDIEPQFSSHGMKTGQNELVSLLSSDEDLKAGMEKQICMLCSFKAITQKELLFHYKLRHPRFYSQNRCTIECKNHANLHMTNLDPQFCEAKRFRNTSECGNAMLEWGMNMVRTKEPLAFGSELELISHKGDRDLIMTVPVREHLRNQNTNPIHSGQKITKAVNSLDVTRLPSKQFPLNGCGSQCLEYNIMPGKQNIDSSDIFCEFDPVNKSTVQECVFGAEDDWQQGDLTTGNEVLSRDRASRVKATCLENTVKHSSLEGYRCGHCARLFKALAGLRNHERIHFTSKTCHRSITKSRKRKGGFKRDIQITSSEGGNYRCPRCSYSTPIIEQLRSHSLKVHGRFLMPKLRAAVSDAEKTGGYMYQAFNENVFLEFPHRDCQDCVQTSDSGVEALKALPKSPEVKNYSCEFCNFTTCQFQNVKKHYRKVHREKLYFECRKCHFFSGKKNALSQHAEVCELTVGDKNSSAKMMNESAFIESSILAGSESRSAVHLKEDFDPASTESESGVLHCPLCLYYTKHKSRMVNHVLEHRNGQLASVEECQLELMHFCPGKVHCCDWCTFVTLSQDNLIQHMDTHSPVKPYKCRLCFFEARLQIELETHLQEQHKVKCNFDLVGAVNLNEADLVIEIEEFQRKRLKKSQGEPRIQKYTRPNRSTKATRFSCEFCGRRFLDRSEWKCHVRRHSIES